MKNLLNKFFGKSEPVPVPEAKPQRTRKPRPSKPVEVKSAKELATERGEPYVNVVSVELDENNIGAGAFELDWNDKFLANLVRAGFQKQPNEPEHVIVDRWFQEICRNVVLETYEQEQADPDIRRVSKRNLGDGRTEIS